MQPSVFTGQQSSSTHNEEETPTSSQPDNNQSNPQHAAKGRLQMFSTVLNWLADFIQLSEKEQKDAGIYFGNRHY